jgi:hypothetical protein
VHKRGYARRKRRDSKNDGESESEVKYEIAISKPTNNDEPIKLYLEETQANCVTLFAVRDGIKAYICTLCSDGRLCLPINESWLGSLGFPMEKGHIQSW